MNKSSIAAANVCLQANIPLNLIGEPGAAKTSILTQLIEEALGWTLRTIITATRAPEDIGGLPMLRETGVVLSPPKWAADLVALGGRPGAVFFDEVNQAPPLMQAALMRVMLEGVVGDTPLGPQIRRVCAMNPTDIAAGGFVLAPPLANRLCHISASPDRQLFLDALTQNFPAPQVRKLPEGWEATVPGAFALLSAFLHVKPSLHHARPKEASKMGQPWPSWRTWTMGMRAIVAAEALGETEEIQGLVLGGLVGDAPALEFLAYRRELDIPDPEDVLKHPEKFDVPARQDRQYAVFSSVTSAVLNKNTPKRWEAGMTALARGAETAPDIALVFLHMMYKAMPSGANVHSAKVITPLLPMLMKMAGTQL